jgi:hypothetical protein
MLLTVATMAKRRRTSRKPASNTPADRAGEKIQNLLLLLVVIVVLCSTLGISQSIVDLIIQLLISLIVGTLFSMLAETIIESFSGNTLKKYLWTITINIGGKRITISRSVFFFVTLVVAFILRNIS